MQAFRALQEGKRGARSRWLTRGTIRRSGNSRSLIRHTPSVSLALFAPRAPFVTLLPHLTVPRAVLLRPPQWPNNRPIPMPILPRAYRRNDVAAKFPCDCKLTAYKTATPDYHSSFAMAKTTHIEFHVAIVGKPTKTRPPRWSAHLTSFCRYWHRRSRDNDGGIQAVSWKRGLYPIEARSVT